MKRRFCCSNIQKFFSMPSYKVDLYVYDLSQGLAKSLAPLLLSGQKVDGIWHTGVVVYGREYFFGSNGVQFVLPGNTILGHTYKIVPMGSTRTSQNVFEGFLKKLAETSFRPESYHLLDHNCNNFSDEVCRFLVGKNIPSHITSLPKDILSTSMGRFLRPLIDEMYRANSDGAGSSFNPSRGLEDQSGSKASSSSSENNHNNSASASLLASIVTEFFQNSEKGLTTGQLLAKKEQTEKYREIEFIIPPTCHPVDNVNILLDELEAMQGLETEVVKEIQLCLLDQTSYDSSKICEHINRLGLLIQERVDPQSVVACKLLQALTENQRVASNVIQCDEDQIFFEILDDFAVMSDHLELYKALAKCVCNLLFHCTAFKQVNQSVFRHFKKYDSLINFLVSCILFGDDEVNVVACQSISNAFLADPNEFFDVEYPACSDMCFKLGISLLEMAHKECSSGSVYTWFSIFHCLTKSSELLKFAQAMNFNEEVMKNDEPTKTDKNARKLKDNVRSLLSARPV